MGGFKGIFPPTLATFKRLHESRICLHKLHFFPGVIKNPFSSGEKRLKKLCALLIFSQSNVAPSWIWHLAIEDALQPVAVVSSGQTLDHSR
jgi:hypothetical protein